MNVIANEMRQDVCDWDAVRALLSRLGDKWTFRVLAGLGGGRLRFKELFRELNGISQRMLTLTLRNLEMDGYVTRIVYPTVPPRVEYELSERGKSLYETVMPLADWAIINHLGILESRRQFEADQAA